MFELAVAKERVPLLAVEDRIPHPKIAYAYLNIQVTGTVEEFLAYRSEVLKKHPLYAESALAKQPDKIVVEYGDDEDALAKAEELQADVEAVVEAGEGTSPKPKPAASAPTDKPKLSARDIARAKILAKKGA